MKNTFLYYLVITAPLLILFILLLSHSISNSIFAILLITWAIIYRPILDGIRLINKGVINKNEIWKLFVPFWRYKWFKELYR
jgi:hypothetical protein